MEDISEKQIIVNSQTSCSSDLTGDSMYLEVVYGTIQFLTIFGIMENQSSESENS